MKPIEPKMIKEKSQAQMGLEALLDKEQELLGYKRAAERDLAYCLGHLSAEARDAIMSLILPNEMSGVILSVIAKNEVLMHRIEKVREEITKLRA